MQGEGFIYKPGSVEVERRTYKHPPHAAELNSIVGGWLEEIPGFTRLPDGRRCVAFCNEEGKLDRPEPLPYNELATQIWLMMLKGPLLRPDYLAGNVIALTGDDEFWRELHEGPEEENADE